MVGPRLTGERVVLRPLTGDDLDPLADLIAEESVARWWTAAHDRERVKSDLQDYPHPFVIEVDGRVAGWLGVDEETDEWYPSAALDVVLGAEFQDRGLGSEALRLVIDWLVAERGHHRITIDPRADNERAIRCYERVGFRRVGVMQAYERAGDGGWHDALLMELVRLDAPRAP